MRVRLRLREGERSREREREETDFGCKGCSQNAAFQVRIFTIFFSLSSPCPVRVRHGHGRQIYVSVLSCLWLTVLLPLK